MRVARFRHHWISVGQLGRATKLFRSEGCRDLIFIGSLVRPALSEIRLDWGTLRVIGQVVGGVSRRRRSSAVGHRPHPRAGRLSHGRDQGRRARSADAGGMHHPRSAGSDAAAADIARGATCCARSSPFDIGQAAVVIDGHVVGGRGHRGHRRAAGAGGAAARGRPHPRQGRARRAGEGAEERPGFALRSADGRAANRRGRGAGRARRVLRSSPATRSSSNRRP